MLLKDGSWQTQRLGRIKLVGGWAGPYMAKEINTLGAIWLGPSLTSIRLMARVPCYLTRSRRSLLLAWPENIPQEQNTTTTRDNKR
jgi:hypothetical protein